MNEASSDGTGVLDALLVTTVQARAFVVLTQSARDPLRQLYRRGGGVWLEKANDDRPWR